jgi:O-6-methylguanine DNA methyltransferase
MTSDSNQNLQLSEYQSPTGDLTIVTRGDIVLICEFSDRYSRVEKQLSRFYLDANIQKTSLNPEVKTIFDEYFENETNNLDKLKTDPIGTNFEKRVWEELRNLKAGETCSYGDLAQKLNSAPRAVGRANGRNPICLIHPCHRVIGADGSLTGYAGGLDRKAWLLKHEGVKHLKL